MLQHVTRALLYRVALSTFAACAVWGCSLVYLPSRVEEAARLGREGDIDGAISLYHAHIHERLSRKDRPQWENPYFYLLLMGDLELQRGRIDEALSLFVLADSHSVAPELVTDRLLQVGESLKKRGELLGAIRFLEEHRSRDSILFDNVLDELARVIVEQEEQKATGSGP